MEATFGLGSYSVAEAARLTGLPVRAIRRWLFGYRYDHHGPSVAQPPLWSPQYGLDQDEPVLGFRDLIEARLVGELRRLGIGLPSIRKALRVAAEIAGDDHPFSSNAFRTDGKRLFLERVRAHGGRDLIDLGSLQHNFASIVERSFLALEFDRDKAIRWFPLAAKKSIVLDPARAFGQPIVAEAGVATKILAQAVASEGSVAKVARLFNLPESVVGDAVDFERGRPTRLAA